VQSWRAIFVSAIATLWVAASFHCRLEVLTGFEFLSCCQHSESEQSPAHHEKECNDDGCAAVERGFYKPARLENAPLIPLLGLAAWLSPLPQHEQALAFDHLVSISSAPPELPKAWQFSQRTALPPRTPSFVS
jgi:hypothetical protein